MSITMIRALLLDYDGIIRSMDQQKTGEVIRNIGFELDQFFAALWSHPSTKELVRGTINRSEWWALIQESQPKLQSISADFLWNEVFAYPIINQEILQLVNRINDHYVTAILSNADPGSKEVIIQQTSSAEFDYIMTSSDFGSVKPEPEIYFKSLEKMGVEPRECLFFDDSRKNVDGAREIGIQAYQYESVSQVQELLYGL